MPASEGQNRTRNGRQCRTFFSAVLIGRAAGPRNLMTGMPASGLRVALQAFVVVKPRASVVAATLPAASKATLAVMLVGAILLVSSWRQRAIETPRKVARGGVHYVHRDVGSEQVCQ